MHPSSLRCNKVRCSLRQLFMVPVLVCSKISSCKAAFKSLDIIFLLRRRMAQRCGRRLVPSLSALVGGSRPALTSLSMFFFCFFLCNDLSLLFENVALISCSAVRRLFCERDYSNASRRFLCWRFRGPKTSSFQTFAVSSSVIHFVYGFLSLDP